MRLLKLMYDDLLCLFTFEIDNAKVRQLKTLEGNFCYTRIIITFYLLLAPIFCQANSKPFARFFKGDSFDNFQQFFKKLMIQAEITVRTLRIFVDCFCW